MSNNIEINNNFKYTGIIKNIDGIGRFVLPSPLRQIYKIDTGNKLQINVIDNFIVLKNQENNKKQEKCFYRIVDELGRFVIPVEIRNKFELPVGTPIGIYVNEDNILLKKEEISCTFCNNKEDLIEHQDKLVCLKCIGNLNKKSNK